MPAAKVKTDPRELMDWVSPSDSVPDEKAVEKKITARTGKKRAVAARTRRKEPRR